MNKKIIAILIISILCMGIITSADLGKQKQEKNTNIRDKIEIVYVGDDQIIKHPSGLEQIVELADLQDQLDDLIDLRKDIDDKINDKTEQIQEALAKQ